MTDDHENNEQLEAVTPVMEAGQQALLSEQQMEDLEARVVQQQQIRQIVLKTTKPHHWRVMGNAAYLEQMGCKVVASFLGLGLDVDDPVEKIEVDDAGSYYSFSTKITVKYRGREIDELGYADSRDKFLAGNKPQSEVNKGNIKKKSITNAMNRGIKAFLGLDFTREEVEKVVGSLGGGAAVNYKSKPKEEMTANEVALKDEMKLKIWKMCDKDEARSLEYLEKLTAFKTKEGDQIPGRKDFEKVSAQQWKFKKKQVDADFVKWESEQGGQ